MLATTTSAKRAAVRMAVAAVAIAGAVGQADAATKNWDAGAGTSNLIDSNNYGPANGHPTATDIAVLDYTSTPADYVFPDVMYWAGTGRVANFSQVFGTLVFDFATPGDVTIYSTPDGISGRVGFSANAGSTSILSLGSNFGSAGPQTLTLGDSGTFGNTLIGLDLAITGGEAGIDVTNEQATLVINSIIRNKLSDSSQTHGIEKTGAGTLVLGGANQFGGAGMKVKLTGGTTQIAADGGLGHVSNQVVFNGGTLRVSPTADVSLAHTMDTGVGAVVETPTAFNSTINAVISGAGSFTKTGTGSLTLTKSNTFGGAGQTVTIKEGTLAISADSNLGASDNTVTLDGGTLQSNATSTLTSGHNYDVTAAGGTINLPSAGMRINGVLSGSGTLTKTGASELMLDNAAGTFNGTLVSAGGNVRIFNPATLAAGTVVQMNGANPTLNLRSETGGTYPIDVDFSGATGTSQIFVDHVSSGTTGTFTVGNLKLGASVNLNGNNSNVIGQPEVTTYAIAVNNVTLTTNASVAVSKTDVTVNGSIGETGGSRSLKKAGPKTLTLTQPSTFTGGVNLAGGVLQISSDDQLGAAGAGGLAPVTVATDYLPTTPAPVTLRITGSYVTNRPVVAGDGTIENAQDVTMGAVTGSGLLVKNGAGRLTVPSIVGGSLSVGEGTFELAAGGGGGASKLASFGYGLGKLDVTDNKVVFSGPAAESVRGWLLAGGIVSSTAQADATGTTGVGYLTVGATGLDVTTWGGVDVLAGDVVTKLTYTGDINLDGKVNGDDFTLMDRGLARYASGVIAANGAVWVDGDVNYDGTVTSGDFLLADKAFARNGGVLSPEFLAERDARFGDAYVSELVAAVPEPATVGLVVAAGAAMSLGRRRRAR